MNRKLTHLILAVALSMAYAPLSQAQMNEVVTAPTTETTVTTVTTVTTDESAPDAAVKAMTPEEQAMMEKFQAYSTPNENHQLLAGLAGNWTAKVTHWMKPEAEGESSDATVTSEMIMGGRFLQQKVSGMMMGQPFEGVGLWGYDNITKKFSSLWYDNMSTGIMGGDGTYDAATKKITEEGMMTCPITDGKRWYRTETTLVDSDHYIYEMYMKDESGKEFRGMLIEYSRAM